MKRKYRVTFTQRYDYDVEVEAPEGSSDFANESEAEDKAYDLFRADMHYPVARTEYDEVEVELLDGEG